MNDFQRHPMQNNWKGSLKKWTSWFQGHVALTLLCLVLGIFTLKGIAGAIQVGQPFSIKQIVLSAISQGLETDSEGHTNILLLGVGGAGHDGEYLTDTMMVVSIDNHNKWVSALSLPRDIFVENKTLGWGTRLNSIYQYLLDKSGSKTVAVEELKKEVQNITGVPLQYYAMVNFSGFEDIVDAIGGITVDVKTNINDETYPAPDGSIEPYDPFNITAGLHDLNGKTALKYARSRHGSSDFDRALRQQEVISAIKDKALSLGVLSSPSSIKNIVAAVSNNFETDMSITEILTLAGQADKFNKEHMASMVLSDAANMPGGLLFAPERELYEGAYVLVPYVKDFVEVQEFAKRFIHHPQIFKNPVPIQILNGTGTEGLAGTTKMHLLRHGFDVVDFGNADTKDVSKTQIYLYGESEPEILETMAVLTSLIPGQVETKTPDKYKPENFPSEARIIIELGSDFQKYIKAHPAQFYLGFF